MRARLLKPGFFTNEVLAEVPPLGRILFEGLWVMADRRGRLEDRPKRIKAEVLPYDDANVDDLLNRLHERGFILRYVVNGARYIQVIAFNKHQTPHCREAESTIPEPQEHDASTVLAQCEHESSTPVTVTVPINPPTPFQGDAPSHTNGKRRNPFERLDERQKKAFECFWERYPRKVAKQQAQRAWAKLDVNKDLYSAIRAGLDAAMGSDEWRHDDGEFIPYPATWLNGRRWEDEGLHLPDTSTQPTNHEGPGVPDPAAYARWLERNRSLYQ